MFCQPSQSIHAESWLVGILKHKILDMLRKRAREPQLAIADDENESELLDTIFSENGRWADTPQTWADPEKSFENACFWKIFEQCNQRMSINTVLPS
ncbi:MAG: hypothetical protein Q7S71_05210 [Candidatus Nitrotoga sp.]|nr:hypothetical protein [Candidatus Nitrotoga sp.]